jgi:hypothetical protein
MINPYKSHFPHLQSREKRGGDSHGWKVALRYRSEARHGWLMPVILATRDQEDRGSKPA